MRDLSTEELKHVYGAGSSYSSSQKKQNEHGSKSKGHSKHASKERSKGKSKKRNSYC